MHVCPPPCRNQIFDRQGVTLLLEAVKNAAAVLIPSGEGAGTDVTPAAAAANQMAPGHFDDACGAVATMATQHEGSRGDVVRAVGD